MTDAYQNRTATAVARLRYGAIGSDSFHDCSCASLPAYDILTAKGQRISCTGRFPGEHTVQMAWTRVPGCRRDYLRCPASNCAAVREHAVRSSGQVNRDPAGFQPAQHGTATELMDTDPVSFKEFDDYLRDLEPINVLTLAYRPTL